MKVVLLIVSFFVSLLLIRIFAFKLQRYLRVKEFRMRAEEAEKEKKIRHDNQDFQTIMEPKDGGEIIINLDKKYESENPRVVVKGTLISPKQNLDSKYIGSVYRKKNGRFGSKKELQDV